MRIFFGDLGACNIIASVLPVEEAVLLTITWHAVKDNRCTLWF